MGVEDRYQRECPGGCGKILSYSTQWNLNFANKNNKKCKSCSFKGKVGKYERTSEIKEKIGEGNRGKKKNWTNNELRKQKISESLLQIDYKNQTKEERYEKRKIENEKNKGKILEYNREYQKNNKDKIKKWFQDNKEKICAQKREKWKNDPQYKLKSLLRTQLYHVLIGRLKSESALNLLGCSVEYLKQYLENQFLPEMNWSNHGKIWEIDHIKPCSGFNLENLEEQKECFHFSNLQPLFKTTEIAESLGYEGYVGNRDKYCN